MIYKGVKSKTLNINKNRLNQLKKFKILQISFQLSSESKFLCNSKNEMEDSYENALKEQMDSLRVGFLT